MAAHILPQLCQKPTKVSSQASVSSHPLLPLHVICLLLFDEIPTVLSLRVCCLPLVCCLYHTQVSQCLVRNLILNFEHKMIPE